MKKTAFYIVLCIFPLMLAGCRAGSLMVKGDDCKMNGSMEVTKGGLPVNWYYYTSRTVPEGDFDILADSTVFKDGNTSLKFEIRECSTIGGRYSPGFFKTFKVVPGDTYSISFWVINHGCFFEAEYETGMKGIPGISGPMARTKETFKDWKYFEYSVEIPMTNDKVNILTPGSIWFDDIRIVNEKDGSGILIYPYVGDQNCK